MNAKDQKKAVLELMRKVYPSMTFTFNGKNYYSTLEVIENISEVKQLIKKL